MDEMYKDHQQLEQVVKWVSHTENMLNSTSQSQIQPLPEDDVNILLERFGNVMKSKSSYRLLSTMTHAISSLFRVTQGLSERTEDLVMMLQLLVNSLLDLYHSRTEDQKTVRSLGMEVAEIIAACGETDETKMLLLDGLTAQLLSVVTSDEMETWIRRDFLKVRLSKYFLSFKFLIKVDLYMTTPLQKFHPRILCIFFHDKNL